jgi:UDP-N-acetylglucosamine--N-acetylmuramyl-(pentapeptide) pyrophosphoryl-undecaprenol N-acetylglucosamine transferase
VPLLAVSSTGGHLVELHELLPRLSPAADGVEWVTFDTPQSRSMLRGERVHFVRLTPTRDPGGVLANVRPAGAMLRSGRFSRVVSTGAGVALSFLPLARLFGVQPHYIESATRLEAPSTTGQMLAVVPGVRTYTQADRWAGRRWTYRGSVLDAFAGEPLGTATRPVRRAVVILGTNPYAFPRLLERLMAILPPDVEVTWQTGFTDASGLPIAARAWWPAHELDAAMAAADVVIAHAGMGTTLAALRSGHVPVLVPRRADRGEQVDDHQLTLARELGARGLAVPAAVEALDMPLLERAAALRAHRRPDPPPFVLDP